MSLSRAVVPARQAGRPLGWWGMLIVIASEGTLFVAMMASYQYLRFQSDAWPQGGIAPPDLLKPVLLTALLVASSAPLVVATRAAGASRLAAARWSVLVALCLQAAYLAYQLVDYRDQLDRLPASRNAYASIYQTLLGVDHAHVAVALVLELWLLARLAGGLTRYRANATVAIAWYGHFVNLATVLVTATLLSARL